MQNAKKLSAVKIVSYDWLEDSLLSNTRRPKPEGPYLLKNLMKPDKKEVQKKKVTPKSSKVAKEIKGNIPKRRTGISFPELHFIATMQTVLTCRLQLILSSLQRAKESVSMILSYQMAYPGLIITHHSRASGVPGPKDKCGLQYHLVPPIETTGHQQRKVPIDCKLY